MDIEFQRIIFGSGSSQTQNPKAPLTTIGFTEEEVKSELIFKLAQAINIPPSGKVSFTVKIPDHLKNKNIIVIIHTWMSSNIRLDVYLLRLNTAVWLSPSSTGPQHRIIQLFIGDGLRLEFINTSSTDTMPITFLEVWAYDMSKRKIII